MEITNRHREPWTQTHGVQGNPAHEQTQTPALLNPIKSERSNWLLRLSPDVLIKMMTHYLKLSETALLMLSCRHIQHLVNSHYPWKALYQQQLHNHQYLYDPFSYLIQDIQKSSMEQASTHKLLYRLFLQKCIPWNARVIDKRGMHLKDIDILILSNGNIAVKRIRIIDVFQAPNIEINFSDLYILRTLIRNRFLCLDGCDYNVACMAALVDGRLVTADARQTNGLYKVHLWSAKTGLLVCIGTFPGGHRSKITCIAVLPDNIVTGSQNGHAYIWPFNGEKQPKCLKSFPHQVPITCIAVLPNGNFALGFENGTAAVWLWDQDKEMYIHAATLIGHKGKITCMAALLNGNIVTGSADRKSLIFLPDGTCIGICDPSCKGEEKGISAIAILASGNFATVHFHRIYIWSPEGHLLAEAKGHEGEITSIAALPDGGFVTASYDGTAKMWSPIGAQVSDFTWNKPINCIKVFPSGEILLGCLDGTVISLSSSIFKHPLNVKNSQQFCKHISYLESVYCTCDWRG